MNRQRIMAQALVINAFDFENLMEMQLTAEKLTTQILNFLSILLDVGWFVRGL